MIRHEVASALLAWDFREWLEQCPECGFYDRTGSGSRWASSEAWRQAGKGYPASLAICERVQEKSRFIGISAHPYFKKLIRYGIQTLGLPRQVKIKGTCSWWDVQKVKQKRFEILDQAFADWEPDEALLAVVKALLIAGDSFGSASAQYHF